MDPLTHELDDARLVAAVGALDELALQEVYRRHGDGVYGLARRVLVDAALAEEVTQEVFLRLWDEPHRFDPARGALRSFLLRQAHSRAVERVRSEEARRRREERVDRENVDPARRRAGGLGADPSELVEDALASCRRASARPSSSPTSAATATARSRSCWTSPRARSRVVSAWA